MNGQGDGGIQAPSPPAIEEPQGISLKVKRYGDPQTKERIKLVKAFLNGVHITDVMASTAGVGAITIKNDAEQVRTKHPGVFDSAESLSLTRAICSVIGNDGRGQFTDHEFDTVLVKRFIDKDTSNAILAQESHVGVRTIKRGVHLVSDYIAKHEKVDFVAAKQKANQMTESQLRLLIATMRQDGYFGKPGPVSYPFVHGLDDETIQRLHGTEAALLEDDDLLLSTICGEDLRRKNSKTWDESHPKCLFCGVAYRFRKFFVQCHMDSQITRDTSGGTKRTVKACQMHNQPAGSELKARFLEVQQEIHKRFTAAQQASTDATRSAQKRKRSTVGHQPGRNNLLLTDALAKLADNAQAVGVCDGASGEPSKVSSAKKQASTIKDRMIKKPSQEEFVNAWSDAVAGKGLTLDFLDDPLVRRAILITAQCGESILTFKGAEQKDAGQDTLFPTSLNPKAGERGLGGVTAAVRGREA